MKPERNLENVVQVLGMAAAIALMTSKEPASLQGAWGLCYEIDSSKGFCNWPTTKEMTGNSYVLAFLGVQYIPTTMAELGRNPKGAKFIIGRALPRLTQH